MFQTTNQVTSRVKHFLSWIGLAILELRLEVWNAANRCEKSRGRIALENEMFTLWILKLVTTKCGSHQDVLMTSNHHRFMEPTGDMAP